MCQTTLLLVAAIAVAAILLPHPVRAMEGSEIRSLDKSRATSEPGNSLLWHDMRDLEIEGKGWSDTNSFFDRLPARAQGVVREPVWDIGQWSAGICARFVTDSSSISARWTLRFENLALVHMPASGVSGLDLYVKKEDGTWRWLATGMPHQFPNNEQSLTSGMKPGRREYLLYLPLYNGVESVKIGIAPDAMIAPAPKRIGGDKPICFYGTSITHGGCASRPGMTYPAILGRQLDRPVINLGFSGNGPMDLEMTTFLGELDPSVYVIDCLPNMSADMVTDRAEPFVKILRQTRPDTPILLVENITYQNAEFVVASYDRYTASNKALRRAYRSLISQGVQNLHYLKGDKLLGKDGEATVDGTHPTDLGFLRMADAFKPMLKRLISNSR